MGRGAVEPAGVEVGAARDQVVDQFDLPGHDGPVDRPVGTAVAGLEKPGIGVQQPADALRVAVTDGGRHGLAPGGGIETAGQGGFQESLHRPVAAVAGDLDQGIVDGEAERVGAAVEEQGGDVEAVFADGEIQGCPVGELGAGQRGVPVEQVQNRVAVAVGAGLEQRADVGAQTGGPQEGAIRGQGGREVHSVRRGSGDPPGAGSPFMVLPDRRAPVEPESSPVYVSAPGRESGATATAGSWFACPGSGSGPGPGLDGGEAAIDAEHLTGDPALGGIEEPPDGVGDFVGFSDAAEGVERGRGLDGGFGARQSGGERGARESRGDTVHPDPMAGVGGRGGAGETDDSGLGGGDGFVVDEAAFGDRGRHQDDRSAGPGGARGHHQARRRAQDVEGRRQIRGQDVGPFGVGGGMRRFQQEGTHAIHHPVQAAEAIPRRRQAAVDGRGVGGVRRDGVGREVARQGFEAGGAATHEGQVGAGGRELTRQGGSDAAAGAEEDDAEIVEGHGREDGPDWVESGWRRVDGGARGRCGLRSAVDGLHCVGRNPAGRVERVGAVRASSNRGAVGIGG
jgi:hypothetical protein